MARPPVVELWHQIKTAIKWSNRIILIAVYSALIIALIIVFRVWVGRFLGFLRGVMRDLRDIIVAVLQELPGLWNPIEQIAVGMAEGLPRAIGLAIGGMVFIMNLLVFLVALYFITGRTIKDLMDPPVPIPWEEERRIGQIFHCSQLESRIRYRYKIDGSVIRIPDWIYG
ncbi:uncharacterized protein F4822DRAFT_322265 [Hypoxylon trugodes]|uniref:uncharacterized protein n=1 Tax=Hypoxylon trugodes TaxID=326681 RepID=UPI002194F305|nr:uncharacterized protein F4822DRAFT_322265 [Hypoxylon trugodes]KAI1386632.1 hypothetical protein F4822DRAFT_322265 [Hypoxylon trugodes]